MIEFAKFAKSWVSSRNVERAYEKYRECKTLSQRGVQPLTEGKTKTNIKHYPNGILPKKGPPPKGVIKRNYGKNDMLSDHNLMTKIK
jgi:hypothetical protein